MPPAIGGSHQTEHVPVVKGKSVTLDCTVTGIPEPQTTWHKDHRVIVLSENPHIHILNNGQALQITNAETEDTGLYLCHAENDAGIAKKSYDVEVQGKYKHLYFLILDQLGTCSQITEKLLTGL